MPGNITTPRPNADTRCPACGKENHCVMAAGGRVQDCWCLGADIDTGARSDLPAHDRDRRCLCRHCGTGKTGSTA